MKTGVILSTYNSPEWLTKVLWGYEHQTDRDFEMIIADDGSGPATAEVIERFRQRGQLALRHVWHEDRGFRKCEILNKAVAVSDSDYLIFTDVDCVPRHDFVAVHKGRARPGHFYGGGCQRLTLSVSQAITESDIASGQAFDARWLHAQGQPFSTRQLRLLVRGWVAELLNRMTTAKAAFTGGNGSAWKVDIESVNGFEERMEHGGLDTELGYRLQNRGIRAIKIRYSAICLHLDHSRGYLRPEAQAINLQILKNTRQQRLAWTPYGIQKGHVTNVFRDAKPSSRVA